MERWLLRLLGEHGLSWSPAEPWAEPWGSGVLLVEWQQGEPVAEISWAQRGTLMALVSRYRATGERYYFHLARRLVDGLLTIAVHHADGLFFPEGYYRRGGWRHTRPGLHPGIEEYNAAVAVAALRFYEAAGYEPALRLAQGLIDFTLRHASGYTADGRFRPPQGELEGHFHTRTNFILSVLKLGILLGRQHYVDWARGMYEHARTWGTDFGWFPEGLGCRHGEICCITDMIEMALLLGRHVDRRYYADAERFGRNHLLESQFLSLDLLCRGVENLPAIESPAPWDGAYSRFEGVIESQVGGFASRSTLNDAFHLDSTSMMQCCNAAGVRALYDLWRYAIEESGEREQSRGTIHLRFSTETPLLRVISYEPDEGRLDITAKQPCHVAVRLPEGVHEAKLQECLSSLAQPLMAQDGYVHFVLRANETTIVHYPLPERTAYYEVGSPERRLQCVGYWRGETLMRIEPPGVYYPLYQRGTGSLPAQPALSAACPIESL